MATAAGVESPQLFEFGGSLHGADLAIVSGMDKRTSTSRAGSLTSLTRVVRGFAEASLMVAGFAAAILLIGTPLALLVRGLYEGLSWLVGRGGETSALVDAFVSLFSIGGGVVLLAVFVRLLVGFFDWRRRFRARVSDAAAASP
ncbi:MAG TPA: hypothetical protein VH417_07015 [Vicinamibacterales bacterium]|jgi:hypothetical protein